MFGKKECDECGEKIEKKYNFCPFCGNFTGKKQKKKDYGMIGENDFLNEFEQFSNSVLGGPGGKMIGKMLESAMKMLEKEMRKNSTNSKFDYEFSVNGDRVNLDYGNLREKEQKRYVPYSELPNGTLKNFSTLSRKEPKTNVKRFSNKLIYEVFMPGVNSEKNVAITKLESNIEVKAVSSKNSYKKILPVNFPITNYNLNKGKLILELAIKE
ncbi:MAG TPA: hypothetical protein VJZ93_01640 [Candidatus Nanoarchaeia archaeon]|nr:hypothetical protein [Candidatus Nanoarchaeia archaeon]